MPNSVPMRLLNAFAGFCLLMAAAMTSPVSAQCPPDTEDPVITDTPANITASAEAGLCGATIDWTVPTATDNCEVTFFGANQVPGDFYAVGITTVTYTAMDAEGNMAASSFTITISDDEDPVISDVPGDLSANNDTDNCSAVVTWTEPTADDNCGIATLTSDHDSGDAFPVGTTTVTYTATDVNGRSVTASFDVTVSDTQSPSITGTPADITQTADPETCTTNVTWTPPTTADNCSTTLTSSHNPGDSFSVGSTTVTYTSTDAASNVTTSSFTVTVTDDEAPLIAQKTDISQNNDATNCSAVVTWTDPAVNDNCATGTLTPDIASGSTFNVGVTTVTYTATDASGNSSTMSFDVTVTDNELPVIAGMPADITQAKDAGSCDGVATWTAPTATDNCTLATLASDISSGTTFDLGPTTVTYTAIDIYGNTATASFTVTITDSDYDGDLDGDCTDPDIDGDGALNAADSDDFNENVCSDTDMDGCDDCSSGTYAPANDGFDYDSDGLCDLGDPDDDNDGALDGADSDDNDANVCSDTDMDGCDDCSSGSYDPANDGTDYDGDGLCDLGDPDDDNDGALDGADSDDNNANVCSDTDMDGCDDCSGGSYDPSDDGTDFDGDGLCDLGDPDDDNDGALDGADSDDNDANVCSDTDSDGCDDCSGGSYDPANDGADSDGDGICDLGDNCSDPLANNYLDPANEECEGCPDAPIFNGISPVTPATTMSSADGAISLDITGNAATTLFLMGINGAPNYTITLPDDLNDLQAGYYTAMVQDADGCWGVNGLSPNGTTLEQPAVSLELIIPYDICCSGCGINDNDADGICDDDDNCTDQTATNFADPANEACTY